MTSYYSDGEEINHFVLLTLMDYYDAKIDNQLSSMSVFWADPNHDVFSKHILYVIGLLSLIAHFCGISLSLPVKFVHFDQLYE